MGGARDWEALWRLGGAGDCRRWRMEGTGDWEALETGRRRRMEGARDW